LQSRWSRSVRQILVDLLVGQLLKLRDVRYNLAEVLQSKAVREAFDVVVLDCPPRLTTRVPRCGVRGAAKSSVREQIAEAADLLKLPFKLASPTLEQLRPGPL